MPGDKKYYMLVVRISRADYPELVQWLEGLDNRSEVVRQALEEYRRAGGGTPPARVESLTVGDLQEMFRNLLNEALSRLPARSPAEPEPEESGIEVPDEDIGMLINDMVDLSVSTWSGTEDETDE